MLFLVKQVQQADYFTIMLDECVDSLDNEQLAVSIRYVDDKLVAYEEFLGLYCCPNTKANTVSVLKDTLLWLNLNISKAGNNVMMREATWLVPEVE